MNGWILAEVYRFWREFTPITVYKFGNVSRSQSFSFDVIVFMYTDPTSLKSYLKLAPVEYSCISLPANCLVMHLQRKKSKTPCKKFCAYGKMIN